ncbi:MAG: YgjP-like metallopeptidase domain-containing protein [Patescibacteria group bacterium]|mgnify:CR=1 FL=1
MYHLYILKCADKTLYTGVTTDLDRRIKEHNTSNLGAKYTSARRPVKLVYSRKFADRSEAQKEESRIKRLSRAEKLKLYRSMRVHSTSAQRGEEYRIIRSGRRTIALHIAEDATLTVHAPMFSTLEYIKKLIFEKRAWINKKQMQIMKNGGPVKPKEFVNGEKFFYLGKIHNLRIKNCNGLNLAARRAKMIKWYRAQALPKITERVNFYSQKTGWKFKSIAITKAESRWGSCSPSGAIHFSWKLIMAPIEVIDYVVVHELAHIPEKNHSARFWNKVAAVLPDYKERKKWLRENVAKFKV